MIHEVDETIRRMISEELLAAGNSIIKDDSQIVFGLPTDDEKEKKAKLYLYLHDVRENLRLRDESFHLVKGPEEFSIGKRPAPLRLDISYILTASAGDSLTEHRLLGDALAVLVRNNVVPPKYLSENLREEGSQALLLSVAQSDHPAHNDAPKLFQSLGTVLKPTLTLVATAKFNPYETKFIKVVREAIFALGQGVHPEGPNRQMDVKSIRVSAAGLVSDKKNDRFLKDVNVSVDGRLEQTLTDDRGFFHFDNLPPGRYTLRFRKFGMKTVEAETVAPPPGRSDALQPLDISMVALSDAEKEAEEKSNQQAILQTPAFLDSGRRLTVSLVGTLRFPDGSPAAYVPVRIGNRTAVTDIDGSYHFTGLPPGEHEIIAEVPGRGEIPVMTSNGTASLEEHPESGKKAKAKA